MPDTAQSAWCQRCHATAGFSIRDPISGETLELFIDPDTYVRSVHAAVPCRRCHERGYRTVPHTYSGYYPRFLCVDCHREDRVALQYQLSERKQAVLASVHGRVLQQGRPGLAREPPIDCHECHDPHELRPVRVQAGALVRVAASNAICLRCHGDPASRLPGREQLRNVAFGHDLFPNVAAHFRKVRCVSCHVPPGSSTLHDIVPAARALRDCVLCHAEGSPRLLTTYDPRASKSSDSLQRNAYVIGSTRSALLDVASQLLFAGVLLMTFVHAAARVHYARTQRRKERP